MGKEIRKTKQIGVRFDKDLLEGVIKGDLAGSPQKALNLYEKSFIELVDLKIKINNQPESKEKIEEERNSKSDVSENAENPLNEDEAETTKEETTVQRLMRENREKFLNKKNK